MAIALQRNGTTRRRHLNSFNWHTTFFQGKYLGVIQKVYFSFRKKSTEHLQDLFCGGFCHLSGRGVAPFNGANPCPIHRHRFCVESALIFPQLEHANFSAKKASRFRFGISLLYALKSDMGTGPCNSQSLFGTQDEAQF